MPCRQAGMGEDLDASIVTKGLGSAFLTALGALDKRGRP
ncbi:hypothetical protein DF3PB_3020001 [uncultured Defluviicoccus sp.]|uniref:Uncharacterized protein n=1 Tax=metagenome TaxID=256318 RepID=A0A380TEP8_9ZZZZ|nr:hypothetical protein DF3PB_3020001 [uncultured Defluviicoccus sp.]